MRSTSLAILDLERVGRQPLRDCAVELSEIWIGVVERPGVVVAQVGKYLRARLDGVDVVAVQLLSLVALRGVVPLEPRSDVLEDVAVLPQEEVELRVDHRSVPRASEHHASSR